MRLYSIKDKLSEEFGPVYNSKNDAVARRVYNDVIKGREPSEYELYFVGVANELTGEIITDGCPSFVSEVSNADIQ